MTPDNETQEVSLCVSEDGDAAVFVTRTLRGLAGLQPARLAAALAEHGLRLVGVSTSERRVSGECRSARSTRVTTGSLLDAVLALAAAPWPQLAAVSIH
jgi:hypothetical protein